MVFVERSAYGYFILTFAPSLMIESDRRFPPPKMCILSFPKNCSIFGDINMTMIIIHSVMSDSWRFCRPGLSTSSHFALLCTNVHLQNRSGSLIGVPENVLQSILTAHMPFFPRKARRTVLVALLASHHNARIFWIEVWFQELSIGWISTSEQRGFVPGIVTVALGLTSGTFHEEPANVTFRACGFPSSILSRVPFHSCLDSEQTCSPVLHIYLIRFQNWLESVRRCLIYPEGRDFSTPFLASLLWPAD